LRGVVAAYSCAGSDGFEENFSGVGNQRSAKTDESWLLLFDD
jgi:hypothetical protein